MAEMGWDDVITTDNDFTLLDAGNYEFQVENFERKRFAGSAKMSGCWQAALNVTILKDGFKVKSIAHNLFLHEKCIGQLAAFARSIGQRKHGDQKAINWQGVPGSRGWCHVGTRKYTNKDGEEKETNEITKFLDPPATDDTPF
jgi:hypothetical protein